MTRKLNRIYIRLEDVGISMYKRQKERGFFVEDLMRMHWDRQGTRAIFWARRRIEHMKKIGILVSIPPPDALINRKMRHRRMYCFTDAILKEWNLD